MIICDGCKAHIGPEENDPPRYEGDVRRISDFGSTGRIDWDACSPSCIQEAIHNAIKKDAET